MKLLVPVFILLITINAYSQHTRKIKLENSEISYTTYGKGKSILIINGGPGMSSAGFGSLAKKLSKTHQTIIYDQRGTGKSDIEVNAKTMTIDLMVKDIETIRTHLKIDSWIIMGHSFGGMLGSYYTSKHPKHVDALILSSSGGMDLSLLQSLNITSALSQKQRDSLNYWSRKIANGDTSYHARLERGKNLAPAYLYDKSLVNKVAKRLTEGNMQINNLIWQDLRRIDFNCKADLKSFKKPVLIIQGKQDIIDKKIAEDSHKLFQNSTLTYIDKSAHYGWLEQPLEYYSAINTFLSKIKLSERKK